MKIIDIRSDTVTKPTLEMRKAMYEAEVGDDVCGDDPTVIRLEKIAAEITGKEAALLVPSGTFGNQLCLFTHCERGNEVILDESCHIVEHEAGASSVIAGVQLRTVKCEDGILSPEDIDSRMRKSINVHFPETGLVCLENAHSSGRAIPIDKMKAAYGAASANSVPVHLDGARLFNAAVALGVEASEITKYCDSVMFCLSKGLCAPIGSIVAGDAGFIEKSRFKRKIMGGGMRQAGVIAAPGITALEKMTERLHVDHENAKKLADGISWIRGVDVKRSRNDINMVFFTINRKTEEGEFVEFFKKRGIMVYPPESGIIRFVTNNGVEADDIEHIVSVLSEYMT
jgi:threonine aldolase